MKIIIAVIIVIIILIVSEADHIIYHICENESAGVPLPSTARLIVKRLICIINEIDANLTLVDFGCSNGDFINYISQYHNKIIGIEINKKQAAVTANRFASNNNITIIATDMTNYLVADNHILYMYEPMWLEPDKAIDVYAKVFSNCKAKYVIYITGVTKLAPILFFELFGYKLIYMSYISRMIIFSNIVYLFAYTD